LTAQQSLLSQILNWQEIWAYRPGSWILIPTIVHFFRDNFVLISIFHFSLFLSGLCLILRWSKLDLTKLQASLALIATSLPAISSAVFFSPINQMSASLALFFIGLGFYVGDLKRSKKSVIIESILFILALLCYEIVAPLLLFKFLSDLKSDHTRVYLLRIPLIFLFVILFQKIVAPIVLGSESSRIEQLNVATGLSFLLSLLFSIPLQLIGSFFSQPIIFVVVLLGSLFLHRTFNVQKMSKRELNDIFLLVIALLSNAVFFMLSSNYSEINSYQNRGLTCTWLLISVILVKVLTNSGAVSRILLIILITANLFVFADKLVVDSHATVFRNRIVEEVASKAHSFHPDSILVIDSHCVVPGNKYRIEVFCTSWDAKGALRQNGVVAKQVLVTEDPGFLNLYNLLPTDSTVVYLKFDSNFHLLQVEQINGIKSEGSQTIAKRANSLSNRRVKARGICKSILTQPWNSIGRPKFIECLEDPLQYREMS
jgi:hypothetical protein